MQQACLFLVLGHQIQAGCWASLYVMHKALAGRLAWSHTFQSSQEPCVDGNSTLAATSHSILLALFLTWPRAVTATTRADLLASAVPHCLRSNCFLEMVITLGKFVILHSLPSLLWPGAQ